MACATGVESGRDAAVATVGKGALAQAEYMVPECNFHINTGNNAAGTGEN